MATYLYCLLATSDSARVPAGLTGLGGSSVRPLLVNGSSVDGEGLGAWVSTIHSGPVRDTIEESTDRALVHHAVVQAAVDAGLSPLPARLGQRFADDDCCRVDLARHLDELQRGLARLDGMVEMRILVTPTSMASPSDFGAADSDRAAPDAGRRYLEAIRERARGVEDTRRALRAQLDRVDVGVGHLARDTRRQDLSYSSARMYGGTSHLVPRSDVAEYRAALAGVILSRHWRLVVSGPQAPYSFCATPPVQGHDSGSPTSTNA